MAREVDPRNPDVTPARPSVVPFVILTIVMFALVVAAHTYWPHAFGH